MTGCNKNFENRVRRLEVIAISAKVVNVAPQAPYMFKQEMNGSEHFHLRVKCWEIIIVTIGWVGWCREIVKDP